MMQAKITVADAIEIFKLQKDKTSKTSGELSQRFGITQKVHARTITHTKTNSPTYTLARSCTHTCTIHSHKKGQPCTVTRAMPQYRTCPRCHFPSPLSLDTRADCVFGAGAHRLYAIYGHRRHGPLKRCTCGVATRHIAQ